MQNKKPSYIQTSLAGRRPSHIESAGNEQAPTFYRTRNISTSRYPPMEGKEEKFIA
jgi:hypothetical protein